MGLNMRIVIDMQGAQGESRFRGIGRYSMAFARGVIRNRGAHEIILVLNGQFAETIEPIRSAFEGLLPQEQIKTWCSPGPVSQEKPVHENLRHVAELMRESFLMSLQPDVVHLTSLFEGYVDNAVTSIHKFDQLIPVSVSFYDLIPFLNPEHYLCKNQQYASFYYRKIDYLKKAALFLGISESAVLEALEFLDVDPKALFNVSTAIDDCFQQVVMSEASIHQLMKKFDIQRPFVMYSGGADSRKNLFRLIEAYSLLSNHLRSGHQLLFAGKIPTSNVLELKAMAERCGLRRDEIVFTGYVSDEELIKLYNLCRVFVFPSWHEGFGLPPLEAMACGAPVIAANTSSLPEVIGFQEALFDPFDVKSMAKKMKEALEDETFRNRLRNHGLRQVLNFSWDETAKRAIASWETLQPPLKPSYLERTLQSKRLCQAMAEHLTKSSNHALLELSHFVAENQKIGIERQLFVDISELCKRDARTGVQRVVRSYLNCLLKSPPVGFRVEPVFASTKDSCYRYARRYTQNFLNDVLDCSIEDEPILWQKGDVFFGLDMQHQVQIDCRCLYHKLRHDGVKVLFLIYDLLPIEFPQFFECKQTKLLHEELLMLIAEMDGAVSISRATADKFSDWVKANHINQSQYFQNSWVHIGADIAESVPSRGIPDGATEFLKIIESHPSFLCVGTLEPRKGHEQILNSFERLWARGVDLNLVFVGKKGWLIDSLACRLNQHRELNNRLFWLEGISDEYLDKVYASCRCLIAGSYGEGFGLPLIEAAQHRLPIIARDIPVFREVAGDCAYYFDGEEPEALEKCVNEWLALYGAGQHPKSEAMVWLSWQESTQQLLEAMGIRGSIHAAP